MKFILSIILLFFYSASFSQSAPQWGNLKPGSYAIGYRTIRTVDYSRNYFGNGRPIQIFVWYPASIKSGSKYLTFESYLDDIAFDWGNDPKHVAYLKQSYSRGFKTGALNPSFPGIITSEQYRSIMNTRIPVVRNAEPSKGKFPVLLHTHVTGVLHQSIMMEYLASHGYVVMSISMYNSTPAYYGRGEETANALLNLTEDLAFVLAKARTLPYADNEKVAMIGMVAQGGLSLQAKTMSLKAIACIESLGYVDYLKQLPFFDEKKIRIPVLELINSSYEDAYINQQKTFMDSLNFSERYIGRFKEFQHRDFYPFPKISRPRESTQWKKYEFMLDCTLNFLNAILKDNMRGKEFLSHPIPQNGLPADFISIRKSPAQKPIPTADEFLTWLRYGDMEKARLALREYGKIMIGSNTFDFFFVSILLAKDNETHAVEAAKMYLSAYPENEKNYNDFGYIFLDIGQAQKSLEIFNLYVKHFPNSPYAYNALSNAYMALHDKEKAILNAKKVLELIEKVQLPSSEKDMLLKSAKEKINR